MLYTRKGDLGDTGLYGCDQRISKSSKIAEALGSLDEANAYLGICKVGARADKIVFGENKLSDTLHNIQEGFFIIQSQIAGSNKNISDEKIVGMETLIKEIEGCLPKIVSFCVYGGCALSASLDLARALSRKAERGVVAAYDEGLIAISNNTLKYLNRSSSILYALARLANMKNDIKEKYPKY